MALAASVRIEIEGQAIDDFLDLSIDQTMNGIQEFYVTCRMDTFEKSDSFIIDESKNFIGSVITISIDPYVKGGDESSPGVFFKGIINRVRATTSDAAHEDRVILSGYSPDILLQDHAGCRSFENKNLKQIAEEILKPFARDILKSTVNPEYSEQIPYCVQYNENRLDFLRRLAARHGEWMFYTGSELVFGAFNSKEEELTLGKDLKTIDFSLNLKAPGYKYVSYDYLKAENVESRTGKSTGKDQQNEVGKHAYNQSQDQYGEQAVFHYPHLNVNSGSYAREQERAVKLEASAITLGMSGLKGSGENMNLIPGTGITIRAPKTEDSGEVDYGKHLITSIRHRCNNLLNYENEFTAIPAEASMPQHTNPGAWPRSEPQIATVTDNEDPEKMGRVRVRFIWQLPGDQSPWIRIAIPYAGEDRGFYLVPEIGDEVLVGFEGGDVERPFVIGSFHNGKNMPADDFVDSENNYKGIITKSNLRIKLDDGLKQTTIETPAGNKVVLSDDGKSILLEDQNQNKVELSGSGIVMDSPKDIKITSKAKVIIEATTGIDISSTSDAKLSGLNVNLEADVGVTAKGNATAELSSTGNTTVKGAMVMIN